METRLRALRGVAAVRATRGVAWAFIGGVGGPDPEGRGSGSRRPAVDAGGREVVRGLFAAAVAVALFLAPAPAAGQDAGPRNRLWLGMGLGSASNADGNAGTALTGQLVWERGSHHVALRALGVQALFDSSGNDMSEIGIVYGATRSSRAGHLSIAAGLAATDAGACGFDCTVVSVGVPVVAEAVFEPFPVLGLGLQGFVNLNRESVFGGVAVMLQLGWMP